MTVPLLPLESDDITQTNPLLINVVLIGPMGAGKTTVGRLLAELAHVDFVDSDVEVEQRTGASIPWIFEKEGESGFRQRESLVIEDLCYEHGLILATGGGAVTVAENRVNLKKIGFVVYLYAPVHMQLSRTARDRNRPLLRQGNPERTLRQLFERRDPLYREIADVVIQTSEGSAKELAQKILQLVLDYQVQQSIVQQSIVQ